MQNGAMDFIRDFTSATGKPGPGIEKEMLFSLVRMLLTKPSPLEAEKLGPLFYPDGFWLDQNNILYIPIPPAFLMEQAKWIQYLKEKGIEYNPDGNWLIVKIPLDRMV